MGINTIIRMIKYDINNPVNLLDLTWLTAKNWDVGVLVELSKILDEKEKGKEKE